MLKCYYVLFIIIFFGCNNTRKNNSSDQINNIDDNNTFIKKITKGEKLFKNKCIACHAIGFYKIGPPLQRFSNVSNSLIKAFDRKLLQHKNIRTINNELKEIEQYISHNKVFVDPKL